MFDRIGLSEDAARQQAGRPNYFDIYFYMTSFSFQFIPATTGNRELMPPFPATPYRLQTISHLRGMKVFQLRERYVVI